MEQITILCGNKDEAEIIKSVLEEAEEEGTIEFVFGLKQETRGEG